MIHMTTSLFSVTFLSSIGIVLTRRPLRDGSPGLAGSPGSGHSPILLLANPKKRLRKGDILLKKPGQVVNIPEGWWHWETAPSLIRPICWTSSTARRQPSSSARMCCGLRRTRCSPIRTSRPTGRGASCLSVHGRSKRRPRFGSQALLPCAHRQAPLASNQEKGSVPHFRYCCLMVLLKFTETNTFHIAQACSSRSLCAAGTLPARDCSENLLISRRG